MRRLLLLAIALTASLAASAAAAQEARIVQWVEQADLNEFTKIALGYPVPVPVDTALPFDGFRSYDGLHMRHQDLEENTPWVHGSIVGSTFNERPIRAYRLGDENLETAYGLPEQAMLTNGGIHAREWQSPEVVTGIMELIAEGESDRHLVDYLRDNANIVVIPVQNIDGLIQTQRYPSTNWLGADPRYPDTWPRDGRMRRKNMRGVDMILASEDDHLLGIDLNRNNAPFWASSASSSVNPAELVYHGSGPASEPETQALDAAAQLGPADRLSMYTDVHSFSQVHFWDRGDNQRLTDLTERLLATFTTHHARFPAGKYYYYERWFNLPVNQGIGTTAEYFTHVYQVPSWTLEIEPSGGSHDGLPGGGADYGGLGRNGHDGFILPESEIARVRTELAQTFTIAYYQQAGPPSVQALRLVDEATGAVVFDAEWDTTGPASRSLHVYQPQAVQLDRSYLAWVAWNKPMRWRENGEVTALPGKHHYTLAMERSVETDAGTLNAELGEPTWLQAPGDAPTGYLSYRDDAAAWSLRFPADAQNAALAQDGIAVTLGTSAYDMTGNLSDANPATAAHWADGAWASYEDSEGDSDNDDGGIDRTIRFELTSEELGAPFIIEPGTAAAWFDIDRVGEGFLVEVLAANRAVMYWFTYDSEGAQDWYMAEGEISGNVIRFPEMVSVSGGEFGPGFDPQKVQRTPVGHARFIWSGCDSGEMSWVIDGDGGPRRQGRMVLSRLTSIMALNCLYSPGFPVDPVIQPVPVPDAARLSGSWYDPTHSGEGYVLEILADYRAVVYWFSYDADGNRRWFYGTAELAEGPLVFDPLYTTSGGIFGEGFSAGSVRVLPWGRLELDLECDRGTARFSSDEEGFPAGELNLVRLTSMNGLSCPETTGQ